MNDDGRAILRQGDVLAQLGDAAGAAARYLDYCAVRVHAIEGCRLILTL